MAFDYGARRIGVAIANEMRLTQGVATVRNGPQGPDWDALDRLIRDWQPDALVVGLPLNMDDSAGPVTALARRFGNRLAGRYHLHLYLMDERLSTLAAEAILTAHARFGRKRAKLLDQVAAQQILESFLAERPTGDEA